MNLMLFVSDRCNMSCDYCFLDLNNGPATVLGFDAASRACADHLNRHKEGAAAQFTFLGGEPLIHFPLVKRIVEHIRAESRERSVINIVTNATLACPEKINELGALGAEFTVSLDGRASTHDGHRRLLAGEPPSSLGAALNALEACDKSKIKVNMVVCEDTAGSLLSNIEFLRTSGFRRLSFHLNILEKWTEPGLEALRAVLEGLIKYDRALAAAAPESLEFTHVYSLGMDGGSLEHSYDDVVLGADGRYYPCDAFFARPYSSISRWAVGDALTGLDWAKRDLAHRQARDFIHRTLSQPRHYSCPRETYFHALCAGSDPAAAVRSFLRADNILGDALSQLAGARRPSSYARS